MEHKHKGARAELLAAAWLLEQGYDVFRSVSPHGPIDIIAIKDGIVRRFDVKTSYRGGCPVEGVEHLSMLADGNFRIMGARKPQKRWVTREETPREKVVRQLLYRLTTEGKS